MLYLFEIQISGIEYKFVVYKWMMVCVVEQEGKHSSFFIYVFFPLFFPPSFVDACFLFLFIHLC